ncbi:MAG: Sir2 family NAD-dependent protein deacetylase [Cetobacterium sp.]
MNDNWSKLKTIIQNSNNIVFFGGATTSVESRIQDFRGSSGLYSREYKNYNPEEILHINFFLKNRKNFNEFLSEKMNFGGIKPHKGHYTLVDLEKNGKLN